MTLQSAVSAQVEGSVRRTVAPAWAGVVATATATSWLALVGWRTLEPEHQLWSTIAQMAGDMIGPAMLVFVLAVVMCEQVWPAVPQTAFCRAHMVDACYLAIGALVVVPMLPLVQAGLSVELTRHASFLILGRFDAMPQLAISALILVGIDAMNLVCTRGQPPGSGLLAPSRAASLPRGHERADHVSDTPAPPRHLLFIPHSGSDAERQRSSPGRSIDRLWMFGNSASRQSSLDIRAARTGICQSCLPPSAPR